MTLVKNQKIKASLYMVNTIVGLLYLSPLIWMIVSAFKPESRIFSDMTKGLWAFIPRDATLENFKEVLVRSRMLHYIANSVLYVTVLVAGSLIANSLFGYALAKFNFKAKGLILSVVLALLVLPLESIILALFFIVNRFHWIDNYAALIVPFMAKCFNIYLFRQFFLDIPDELIEAAAIDGASPLRTFLSLVVPISAPVFTTVFILDYVTYWSDFMWPLLIITDASKNTVQLGLQSFFTEPPIYYGPIMAALTISVLPMLVLFLFLQKYYVQGIATSGIKG